MCRGRGLYRGNMVEHMEVLGPFWNFVYYSSKDFERVEDKL